jgi:hypothetical protein
MSIHRPERQSGESQADYRARRAASAAAVKLATKGPTQAPAINQFDVSRFWLGQHTAAPARKVRREQVKAVGIRQYRRGIRAVTE